MRKWWKGSDMKKIATKIGHNAEKKLKLNRNMNICW